MMPRFNFVLEAAIWFVIGQLVENRKNGSVMRHTFVQDR